ncbi:MAG: chromosomal replication initiator protein DnaA [Chloroflexi bacterium]|nr:chromosomal replication initiator protein DnaA [Chloroflexota bacterium]
MWEAVLGELQLQVPKPSYETWLRGTKGVSVSDGALVILTPNAFVSEMLDTRMYSLISRCLESITGNPMEIRFEVGGESRRPDRLFNPIKQTGDAGTSPLSPDEYRAASSQPQSRPSFRHLELNERYRFDNFIVGSSNNLAHAASVAVSENPGFVYNPLVIYSGVGLGKTHLMHAIGHEVRESGHDVLYTTTEEFTNEYIRSIREGTTEEFRDRYRSTNVLLLDDIQFIIGKEQTQEGFFHTFNALHMAGKQIVITCDRPVSELSLLQDRVSSRLAGGLVVDIQIPDLETRMAILRSKAEQLDWRFPDKVLEFIAGRVQRNVRELEGCLNIVAAHAGLGKQSLNGASDADIDLGLVEQALEDSLKESARRVSEEDVLGAVARYFSIDKSTLKGKKRDRPTAQARHVSMYLLREEVQLPLATIGRVMGGRDHTTVIHACRRIERQLEADTRLRRDLMNIRESFAA